MVVFSEPIQTIIKLLYQIIWKKTIVNNAQAYFQEPIDGVNTIYTCRYFF